MNYITTNWMIDVQCQCWEIDACVNASIEDDEKAPSLSLSDPAPEIGKLPNVIFIS